mmetsp:Transcript_16182/g.48276  ORF Transcript_16182/g.48276 Transcript_16182/m.48276 type:complete len:514 (-) Transcript_16182:24-1565(-)|eukprot:CAMPEP_0119275064 /NCGR_PEP_ID=MMETSP1329-20130426/13159_1 /TAXON_ID=114041 /ORGANISM="Genus nov. species nov., Strain RCC1024" /LENGTH=513 /DNA_ID=CAMNT_0007275423 /DNA_START=23 /DNA_END=1564 /DNA_ORIENTATION=+
MAASRCRLLALLALHTPALSLVRTTHRPSRAQHHSRITRRAEAGGSTNDPPASPLATPAGRAGRWVGAECWVPDLDTLSEEEQTRAAPLYVLDGPLCPGGSHEVSVRADDSGLVQLYDDLLASGGRRIVTTWGVRDEDTKGTSLAEHGCALRLETIRDARAETDGRVKWKCSHTLSRERVKLEKVVARGEGDASYLRCVAREAPDEAPDRLANATVRVVAGKHAGVVGRVEGESNGWVRVRTEAGELVAARGRKSVAAVEALQPAPTALETATDALSGLLAALETTTSELGNLARRLDVRKKLPEALPESPELPPAAELEVIQRLREVAALQREGDEDVRFNEAGVDLLGAAPGVGVGTLWNVAETWLAYLDQRAAAARRRLHADLHAELLDYLRDSGRLPGAGGGLEPAAATLALSELPRGLRSMITTLDQRVADDLEPIAAAKCELQKLLDADSHEARCAAFCGVLEQERGRLLARKQLRSLFGTPTLEDTVQLPDSWFTFGDDEDDDLVA